MKIWPPTHGAKPPKTNVIDDYRFGHTSMDPLPTVLLRHQTISGSHYDWLMVDPRDPEGPLWTGRTGISSRGWALARRWEVEEIAPHRRLYLTYEGPISSGRGSVDRIDQGQILPQLWTGHRIVLDLSMTCCRGLVQLVRIGPKRWRAHLWPGSQIV